MIDLTKPNLRWSDFHITEAEQKPMKDNVFIPFFRVKEEDRLFGYTEHKHTRLPKNLYERLQAGL